MQCPECQSDNPTDASFCNKCGSQLEIACPNCSKANPPGSNFCNGCGHNLSKRDVPREAAGSQPSAPAEPAATGVAPVPEGERRQATVVFSEVLALFGIPTAHEDDPVRAVKAARELHDLVRRISPEVEARIGTKLRMHSGISTGLVVTHLRDIRDGNYGITGDTVNIGARLASHSEADEILVSPETHGLIAPYFNSEAVEEITVKGKTQPTIPYRVTGESTVQTRFEASKQRGFTTFTGREQELSTLYSSLEKTLAGNGQFVTVVGEAGVGKSRLIYEFRHSLNREEITVLQGRCQAYGTSIPYFPHINALKRGLDLRDEDTAAELHTKTVANVLAIDSSLEQYLPLYLHLLSIPGQDYPLPKHLHSQELSNAIQEAITAINIVNAKVKPMVAILEDWHWADPASDAALKHMISVMASYPFMILVIYRPEYSASWANWSHHSPIILKALDHRSSENIIKSIWGVARLPEGIASKIHERTGGNPFFTEEISNALLEEGMVQVKDNNAELSQSLEHLMLPDTVQSVIRARLDRLDHFSRESLRLASVIGREFARRLLEKISSSGEQLSKSLEELKVLEMIQQIRVIPEAEYMFKHIITQEVTYETLLRQKRKELHGLVGRAIEDLYQDRLEEQVNLLYRHFSLAEDWFKAAEYGRRAGNRAYRLGQFQEAVIMFDNAQSCLGQLPDNPAHQKHLVEMQLEMIWPLHFLGQQDRVLEICEVAESLAMALKDRVLMGKILYGYAMSYFFKNEYDQGEQYFLRILEQAGDHEMDELIESAKFPLAVTYLSTGRLDKAAGLYSEVISTRETNGTQCEHSQELPFLPYSHSCHHLAYLRALQGKIKKAKELIQKGSTPEIKQISNLQSRSYCSLWHSSFSYLIGEDYGVLARVNEVLEIAEKTDSPIIRYLCYSAKGNAFMVVEQMEAARNLYEKALQVIAGTEHRRYLEEVYHNLIETTLVLGDITAAEQYFHDATPLRKLNPGRTAPRFDYLKGRLLAEANSPDYARADEFFQKSIHTDGASGAVVLAARTKFYRSGMLARMGETESSCSLLIEIQKQFQNWGIPAWQLKCERALQAI